MSQKKHKKSGGQPGKAAAGKTQPKPTNGAGPRKSRLPLIVGTVIAIAVIVGIAVAASGGKGGTSASAEELKYLGRLLPEGYEAPKVAEPTVYTSDIPMTNVTATDAGAQLTLPVADIAAKKNVFFEYQRADGQVLPMLAYVKPSGKLFVGVSYCPPCEGEGQTITADGALTCDSCGTKRNLETEAGISGSCKLYPLDEVPATVSGSDVSIDKAVLDAWTAQPLDRQIG